MLNLALRPKAVNGEGLSTDLNKLCNLTNLTEEKFKIGWDLVENLFEEKFGRLHFISDFLLNENPEENDDEGINKSI